MHVIFSSVWTNILLDLEWTVTTDLVPRCEHLPVLYNVSSLHFLYWSRWMTANYNKA